MSRLLPYLIVLVLVIYCLIDCIQTDEQRIRNLPKVLWILIILLFGPIGSIAWLFAGRPKREAAAPPVQRRAAPPPRTLAPDDDPSFLAGLDAGNDERRRLAQWERELRDRESELKGPTSSDGSSRDATPRDQSADPDTQDGPAGARS